MSALSRRQALAGMSATAAVAAAPATAIAATSTADRSAWDAAMRDLARARAASDAFDAKLTRIEAAFDRLSAKVPHVTIEGSEAYYGRTLTTADNQNVRWLRSSAKHVRYIEECAYDGHRWATQLIDAADARDAKIKRISDRLGRDAAIEHYDALSQRICDAEERLMNMPAPDGEALLWKVDKLWKPETDIWSEDYTRQTHSDLRRMLGAAA